LESTAVEQALVIAAAGKPGGIVVEDFAVVEQTPGIGQPVVAAAAAAEVQLENTLYLSVVVEWDNFRCKPIGSERASFVEVAGLVVLVVKQVTSMYFLWY
jgi:hypothetical protein